MDNFFQAKFNKIQYLNNKTQKKRQNQSKTQ